MRGPSLTLAALSVTWACSNTADAPVNSTRAGEDAGQSGAMVRGSGGSAPASGGAAGVSGSPGTGGSAVPTGGSTSSAGGAPSSGGSMASGGALTGTDAGAEAGPDAGDPCATATLDAPCSVENTSCGEPCLDPCSFCNRTVCSGGRWTRVEAFPAPCFDCGPETRCQTSAEYCTVLYSDVAGLPDDYACKATPAACRRDVTCSCVSNEVTFNECTEQAAGELLVEYYGG